METQDPDLSQLRHEGEETPRIPLADFARESGVSVSTAWRWATEGTRVRGRRIRLGHVRRGSRLFVTAKTIEEFDRLCTEAGMTPVYANDTAKPHSSGEHRRSLEAEAEAEGL